MAVKRNRWLVISVLVVAIGAFLTISLLPLFAGRSDRSTAISPTDQVPQATDAQTDLEARARGYELVLEREPDNQTALQGLVETRIQIGDLPGVVEPLEKLAERNPDVAEYQVLLGQTKQTLGDLEGAAQAYRGVLTTNPGNMQALQGLAALLIQQNRPQAAIGLLQDTLQAASQTNEVTPGTIDQVSVQLLLAQVYVEDNQTNEALRLYDEIIDGAGDDFRPVLAKALVLQDIDQTAEATVLFEQAEEMAPPQYKDQVRQLATQSQATEAVPSTGEEGSETDEDTTSNPEQPDDTDESTDEAIE